MIRFGFEHRVRIGMGNDRSHLGTIVAADHKQVKAVKRSEAHIGDQHVRRLNRHEPPAFFERGGVFHAVSGTREHFLGCCQLVSVMVNHQDRQGRCPGRSLGASATGSRSFHLSWHRRAPQRVAAFHGGWQTTCPPLPARKRPKKCKPAPGEASDLIANLSVNPSIVTKPPWPDSDPVRLQRTKVASGRDISPRPDWTLQLGAGRLGSGAGNRQLVLNSWSLVLHP